MYIFKITTDICDYNMLSHDHPIFTDDIPDWPLGLRSGEIPCTIVISFILGWPIPLTKSLTNLGKSGKKLLIPLTTYNLLSKWDERPSSL